MPTTKKRKRISDRELNGHNESPRTTMTELHDLNPGPVFFRKAAIHAALARQAGQSVPTGARYWCEQMLGAQDGLSPCGPYTRPNHHRVIAYLLLEIIARQGL